MVFSFGRFPTNDGPPANLKDGISAQGTYPIMTYNLILDGFALSYKFDKYLPKNQSLNFKVLYTPLGNINFSTPYKGLTQLDANGNTVERDPYQKYVLSDRRL